jgi:hypothetical protein
MALVKRSKGAQQGFNGLAHKPAEYGAQDGHRAHGGAIEEDAPAGIEAACFAKSRSHVFRLMKAYARHSPLGAADAVGIHQPQRGSERGKFPRRRQQRVFARPVPR